MALVAGALLAATSAFEEAKGPAGRRFEHKSKSEEARKLLFELQDRVENFQFGAENLDRARKIVALDPTFAMGQYYLSAVTPDAAAAEKEYMKARELAKKAPEGAVPFAIRFGVTFSHLYEGNVDAALDSLRTYLAEYRANGLDAQFPEVFIWNAMARINLENGRLEDAMKAYEKKTWLGRLHHGKARTLARMGKHEQAWAEVETIRKMIEDGGEEAKQYWPAYHYVAGYAKLEAGDPAAALEHLKQANLDDPFHVLMLARAYERTGHKDEAKKAYQKIVDSQWAGIERPLAYPEAKKKVRAL